MKPSIRELRMRTRAPNGKPLRLTDVAAAVGKSETTVCQIERGYEGSVKVRAKIEAFLRDFLSNQKAQQKI